MDERRGGLLGLRYAFVLPDGNLFGHQGLDLPAGLRPKWSQHLALIP